MSMPRLQFPRATAIVLLASLLSCKDSPTGSTPPPVAVGPLTLAFVTGVEQGGIVAMPLDTAMVISVTDSTGAAVPDVQVTFRVDSGGGNVSPTSAISNAAGQVEVVWTLGSIAGLNAMSVLATDADTLRASAIAYADLPDSIFVYAGDAQSELPGRRLPAALQVAVVDRHGNRVPDVPITFSTSGTGVLDSTEVLTDLDGVASAWYTLGASVGAEALSATLLDSAVADVVDIKGGPLAFTANATEFVIASFGTPAVATGDTLRILGSGFSPVLEENSASIGGVVAAIATASPTELAVLVPDFGCVPAALRQVAVSRETFADTAEVEVTPAELLDLAVGEQMTQELPEDFCIQLPESDEDSEYLVGVTTTRPLNASLPARLTAYDGLSTPSLMSTAELSVAPTASTSTRRSADRALREWESEYFRTRGLPARRTASLRVQTTAAAVGDLLEFRVPDISTDPCQNYTTVNTRVVAEGARLIVATDATLPSGPINDALVAAAFDSIAAQVDSDILATLDAHLGALGDLDGNGKLIVVLTPTLLGSGTLGFTSAVDLLERSTCAASDEGEILYVAFPESPTLAEAVAAAKEAGPTLARELAYATQLSRRLGAGIAPLAPWLSEGIAHVAMELAGLAVGDASSDADLGAAALSDETGTRWHRPTFDRLSQFLGWDGAAGRLDGAPEGCSLFGFGGLNVPCAAGYSGGAAWSFARYAIDRAAAGLTPARAELLRTLVMSSATAELPELLETATGRSAEALIVEWAQTLALDGILDAAAAPALQFASWNLSDVFGALPVAQRPAPPAHDFSSFVRELRVVGGGTAYQRIAAAGAHGALALRLSGGGGGDEEGADVGTELGPRLWVVRVR